MTHDRNPSNPDAFDDPSDDPRLTAYALGELAGAEHAAMRAVLEARLADDPAARAFVEETRALAVSLRDGYLAVPAASMTADQRAAVLARAAAPAGRPVSGAAPRGRVLRVSNWALPATAAAALLVGVTFSLRHEIGKWWSGDREMARLDAADEEGAPGEMRYTANRDAAKDAALRLANVKKEQEAGRRGQPTSVDVYYEFPKDWDETQPRRTPPDGSKPADAPQPTPLTSGPIPAPPKPASGAAPPAPDSPAPIKVTKARHSDVGGITEFSNGGGGGGGGARVRGSDVGSAGGGGAESGASGSAVSEAGSLDFRGFAGSGGGGGNQGPALGDRPILGTLVEPKAAGAAEEREIGAALDRLRALGYLGGDVNLDPSGEIVGVVGRVAPRPLDATFVRRLVADGRLTAEQGSALERALTKAREPIAPGESYAAFADNPFLRAIDAPLSTFGIDVDTASYSNVRRFLAGGRLPPAQAVRIEEMVNYFPYRYAPPTDGSAFAAHAEVAGCPWDAAHRLVRVALKGRVEDVRERPAANLVFLIDVSGSMSPDNKLPLLIQSMKQLVPALGERDKVAIVTYAGEAGVALPPTRGDQKETILRALDSLRAGGSTNGAAGIETAYRLAAEGFIPGGVNRVMLATDGDFNVGVSDDDALVRIISEKAKSKVFLSVLGFGDGNLQDKKMEGLADKGNGHYAYIDSLREGRKVLVDEAAATLITIAKDVKIQIEFNPLRVASYRLVGYENRTMAAADFANDAKDAGDLGAGHAVTALYEIVPTGSAEAAGQALRYQRNAEASPAAHSDELLVVKLRWKLPEGDESTYREVPVRDSGAGYAKASPDFKFAAAVASFGMLLRGSPWRGQASFDQTMELATDGLDWDPNGFRAEFIDLVRKAKGLR